jgi:hypothetical protein
LHAAARAAADLLADHRCFTVRRCPAVDCGWLYLDQGGLRQWCTMALCAPPGRRHPRRHPRPVYPDGALARICVECAARRACGGGSHRRTHGGLFHDAARNRPDVNPKYGPKVSTFAWHSPA